MLGYETSGFHKDFFQDTLVEDVYLALPYYFDSSIGKDRSNMFMKLNKSLYLLIQSSLYWYNHLKGSFEARGFKPSPMHPCMFYGRGMLKLINVDDVLLFSTDQNNIY